MNQGQRPNGHSQHEDPDGEALRLPVLQGDAEGDQRAVPDKLREVQVSPLRRGGCWRCVRLRRGRIAHRNATETRRQSLDPVGLGLSLPSRATCLSRGDQEGS